MNKYNWHSTEESKMKDQKWHAVYGAYVALQVAQRMQEGRGAPGEKDFENYVEEAITVADMSKEAYDKDNLNTKSFTKLDSNDVKRRKALEEMEKMSADEIFDLAVRAGIYTNDGELTPPYK